MSVNHNVYIGWYAEFERSKRVINHNPIQTYFCLKEKKHPVKNKVCSLCNGKVQSEKINRKSQYPLSSQILGQNSPEVLAYLTGGRVTIEDLKELEESIAIFPDFANTKKEIIFAPGAKCYSLLSKVKGFVDEVNIEQEPTQKWIDKIKQIFDVEDISIKYGIVMEVI